MSVTLSALVVRAVAIDKRESAAEARDRLWRSVERHAHLGERRGTVVRCVVCSAVLMGAVS